MRNPWFETVAEAQRRARKRLPPSVYAALVAGSEKGVTVEDNVEAFGELGLAPHVAGLPQSRPLENDQSKVAIRPTAPAARTRSRRWAISSLSPIQ